MQDPIKILGVPVHAMTMQEAVKTLEERMLAKEQTFVVTANAEIIMMCQENAEYKKIICEDAELVLPDGAGAVWAGRHLGYKVPERVAGFDLYNECWIYRRTRAIRRTFSAAVRELPKLRRQRPRSFIRAYR